MPQAMYGDWVRSSGEIGAIVVARDWSRTPLGPIERWPQGLCTAAALCFSSATPTAVAWGPERILIYNDPFRQAFPAFYPHGLGQNVANHWPADWPDIGAACLRAESGETAVVHNGHTVLKRNEKAGSPPLAFTFTPVFGDEGTVGGVFIRAEGLFADPAEHTLMEHALRSSEDRFRHMVDMLPVAVYSCEAPSGVITFYNEQAAILWGRSPNPGDTDERFSGSFRLRHTNGDILPRDRTPMAIALAEGQTFRNEEVIIERPDGTQINALVNIDPIRDVNGRVTGAVNAFLDFTAMRRAQAELSEIFENASVGLQLIGPDGIIARANQTLLKALGLSQEEYVGHPIVDFIADQQDGRLVDRIVRGEMLHDEPLQMKGKDGAIRHVLINSSGLFRDGTLVHSRCFATDITTRRRAEQSLRESQERFTRFMEYLPGLAWIKDEYGRYVYANDAATKAFQRSRDDLYGKTDEEVFPSEVADQFIANDRRALEDGHGIQAVESLAHADGAVRHSIVSKFPIPASDGQSIMVGGMAIDITKRQQMEEALKNRARQQQAIASLGEFALRESDLQTVFDHAVDLLADTLGVEYCKILELLTEGNELLLRAGVGWRPGLVGKSTVSGDRESQAGYTLLSDAPVVSLRLADETRFAGSPLLREHGAVSGMSCVIRGSGGAAWGVLGAHSTRQLDLGDEDVNFLTTVANTLGSAIQRKQAEEALRESNEQHRELSDRLKLLLNSTSHLIESLQSRELLQTLLEVARGIVKADAFGIWRADSGNTWSVVSSYGLSEEYITESLRAIPADAALSDVVVVQSTDLDEEPPPLLRSRWDAYRREGIRALLILPLRIHGSFTGTLVFYCHAPQCFSDIEIESARAFSNIAAAAITMSDLYESQKRLRHEAEESAVREGFLATAGAILSESLDYEVTLGNVARAAVPRFADWCSVDLLDEDGELRRVAVAHADPEKVEFAKQLHNKYHFLRTRGSGASNVIRTGEAELISELPTTLLDERVEDEELRRILKTLQLNSYICVPLHAGISVCGVINFVTAESRRRFDARHLSVAQEIAFRASQAIGSAKLYQQLGQSEARYRAVLESQLEMVCRFKSDGTILFVNGAYARTLGTTPDELIGENLWEFVDEKDRIAVRNRMERLRPGNARISIENRFVVPEGVRWTLWTNHALSFDENGRATEIQSSGIDITERKHAEEALRQARDELELRVAKRTAELKRRAEQLGRLTSELTLTEQRERRQLAQILHDHLQQLLVGAKLRLNVLLRSAEPSERTRVTEVTELIDEALGASRSLTVELAPPILHEAGLAPGLAWLARHMLEKHGLQVSATIDERAETEREDVRILLFQSTRELLFNVVKHAGVRNAELELTLLADHLLQIVVSDDGCGFDPLAILQQEIESHAGFGLFSIRERLSLLGGRFEIESAPGNGSRFILVAPQRTAHENWALPDATDREELASVTAAATAAARAHYDDIRVLIVDDHEVMRQGLAALLSDEPTVQVVGEASDGIQAVAQARALNPDVILMDFSMPYMDGVEATRRIKAEQPHIKIIGFSIYEQPDRATAMLDAGASAYHTKGDNIDALMETIRTIGNAETDRK